MSSLDEIKARIMPYINSQEPEGVFSPEQVDGLISVLENIRAAAAA